MSASLGLLRRPLSLNLTREEPADSGMEDAESCGAQASEEEFAQAQIRELARQVFFSGNLRGARHVVFSGASTTTSIASICRRVAETVAAGSLGRVGLVEADYSSRAPAEDYGRSNNDGIDSEESAGALRLSSHQIQKNVWLVPSKTFLGTQASPFSMMWLRGRMGELRREFEYAVIRAPAAELGAESALLGSLADGFVLVLEAHRTRRLAAQRIRDRLRTMNVRLLGTVLSGRTFPIPEKLYRRL
jgi:Mrp family chromosome partitioning ATPase